MVGGHSPAATASEDACSYIATLAVIRIRPQKGRSCCCANSFASGVSYRTYNSDARSLSRQKQQREQKQQAKKGSSSTHNVVRFVCQCARTNVAAVAVEDTTPKILRC